MKIEKLNENQIRCTLTRADLAARNLKLSELAYGTEKAKALFRDMMRQASFDFGFEADDLPLMIEAIPSSADSIVLIITKVEDPEELDTRFSKFTPSLEAANSLHDTLTKLDGADEFLDLLDKVKKAALAAKAPLIQKEDASAFSVRIFSFATIDLVIQAAHLLGSIYHGSSTLYYDRANDIYVLALSQADHSGKEFNKICNMLSEYGALEPASPSSLAFLEEHYEAVVSSNALKKLSKV